MTERRKDRPTDRLRERVELRAGNRCEYCHAPQAVCGYRFHLDHVVPAGRGGSDAVGNRALACASCNLAKSDGTKGVDPATGKRTSLFNPRKQGWDAHFRWQADRQSLAGLTPIGRATIAALDMNNESRLQARRLWFKTGWLP